MPLDRNKVIRMRSLVDSICATEQDDIILAAEAALIGLLNGAMALKHIRMYPSFLAEAVRETISHKASLQREGTGDDV